ncbi:MAG: hypothetical protein H6739_15340 [Alphaproteobacteria bacterium]|nr:hypothetical protein [Alphaproteobacteria bacterium]
MPEPLSVSFEHTEQGWKAELVDFSNIGAFGATRHEALVNALVLAMRVLLERVAQGQPVDEAIAEIRTALQALVARIPDSDEIFEDDPLSPDEEAELVRLAAAREKEPDVPAEQVFAELDL